MTQAANLAALGSNASSTGTLGASSFASATIPNSALSANPTFRNRIINGGMVINQRGYTSQTVSSTQQFAVDRFRVNATITSGSTIAQSSDVPSSQTFTNSYLVTIGTGAVPSGSDYFRFVQAIEGYNIADFGYGTANAKTTTLSFWIKSSVTGTYGVGLFTTNASGSSYVGTYTINSANTWEYKTVTIPGDTGGTWSTDNSAGMYVCWDLGEGPTRSTTAGSWNNATTNFGLTGGTKLASTSGATWYITGVQLEVGSAASPFEVRSYGTELNLCLRYYYMMSPSTQGSWNTGNSFATGYTYAGGDGMYYWFGFPVPMRATPTNLTMSAASTWSAVVGTVATPTSATCSGNTPYYGSFALTGGGCGFGSSGLCGRIRINSSNTYADFSAEL